MSAETELSEVDLKVIELYNKYFDLLSKKDIYVGITKETKECCLIAVELLISENESIERMVGQGFNLDFWQQVENKLKPL